MVIGLRISWWTSTNSEVGQHRSSTLTLSTPLPRPARWAPSRLLVTQHSRPTCCWWAGAWHQDVAKPCRGAHRRSIMEPMVVMFYFMPWYFFFLNFFHFITFFIVFFKGTDQNGPTNFKKGSSILSSRVILNNEYVLKILILTLKKMFVGFMMALQTWRWTFF